VEQLLILNVFELNNKFVTSYSQQTLGVDDGVIVGVTVGVGVGVELTGGTQIVHPPSETKPITEFNTIVATPLVLSTVPIYSAHTSISFTVASYTIPITGLDPVIGSNTTLVVEYTNPFKQSLNCLLFGH
jgi:hypothetical protein